MMIPLYTFLQSTISSLATAARPIDYLEIGVRDGDSLMAAVSTNLVHLAVGIDTWGRDYGGSGRSTPDHVVSLLGSHMDHTLLLTGNSRTVLPGLRHQFDLILVDGDHSAAGCLADLSACLRLRKPSAIILVDDLRHTRHPDLLPAVRAWSVDHSFHFHLHEIGMGIGELST